MKNPVLTVARVVLTMLTVAAIALIFYNSSLSAVASTEQSSPLTEAINSFLRSLHIPLTMSEAFIRKLAHFSEYAVLGTLLSASAYLYTLRRKTTLVFALAAGAFVAVCDELIQLFPAGRSCEVRDMLIDFSGIVFASVIVWLILWITEKRRKVTT